MLDGLLLFLDAIVFALKRPRERGWVGLLWTGLVLAVACVAVGAIVYAFAT
jgi:hypothetical protein